MKSIKYLLCASVMMFMASCFSDKSTDAYLPLSEITISGVDTLYNIDKNSRLVINPVINQSNEEKELKYTWEINLSVYSNDEVLDFVGKELGKFNCRLIVENEDGKAFWPFVLYVNSPYEYGLTVLSEDKDGNSMLSFMQEPMKVGDIAKFTEGDCFAVNNADMKFASHPTDIVHSSGSLIVSCQGSDKEDDNTVIYFLNDKTFVVENYITSKEYPTFKPTKLLVPPYTSEGVPYHVLSKDGKVYDLPTSGATVLQPSVKLHSTYSQSAFVGGNPTGRFDVLLWDNDNKGLAVIFNAYGPFYCGTKFHLHHSDSAYSDLNYFKNVKSFIAMAMIRRTPEQKNIYDREALVLVNGKSSPQKVIMATYFWQSVEGKKDVYVILDNGGLTTADFFSSPIDENTPCIANKTYNTLLYALGNKVKRWYYTTNTDISEADDLLVIDNPNALITGFEMSDDHKKTYVAFYDPTKEGLNGSIWSFDTDKGTVIEKYDNVCYKPVKVIYKKR